MRNIRTIRPEDYPRAAEIYRSNPRFLLQHLGMDTVDVAFLQKEADSMAEMGFLPCVIQDRAARDLLGVLDYRPGEEVYLSLLLLDLSRQRQGLGRAIYRRFEAEMIRQGSTSIRIDVVDEYPDHPGPFWERLGFRAVDRVKLTWGKKTSAAVVMKKIL